MEDLAAAVSQWTGGPLEAHGRLHGGEESDAWVASSNGQKVVIHVSPPWRPPSEVAWAHAVATRAAAAVPQAIAPISIRGETSFSWCGRLVAVYPFVDGEPLDRRDPEQVAEAGRVLARIHSALLVWPAHLRPVILGPSIVDDQLAEPELDAWWSECLPEVRHGVCHGDYYRGNVLVAGRRVHGVIDWNESHVGPLVREVAFAAWEFGHDEGMQLVPNRFEVFVDAYRSEATHLPEWEYSLVEGAARIGLRDNIRYALRRDVSVEDGYQRRRVEALRRLRTELRVPPH